MGASALLEKPSYLFSLTAPKNRLGPMTVTAVGFMGAGAGVFSAPITVDIESELNLVSLKANINSFRFRYIGQQLPISVRQIAHWADRMQFDENLELQ
jgi:hypothetical protein